MGSLSKKHIWDIQNKYGNMSILCLYIHRES